jgi:F0F1-type ATP synthase delta subunit
VKQPRHEIAAAIAMRTLSSKGASSSDALSEEVAAYLISERRLGDLESIMRDIIEYRAQRGIVEVTTVSAYPITDKIREDIMAEVRKVYPDANEIIISHRLDSTVISGVRLEFANQQLDLSVRNKLNKLKQLTASPRKER